MPFSLREEQRQYVFCYIPYLGVFVTYYKRCDSAKKRGVETPSLTLIFLLCFSFLSFPTDYTFFLKPTFSDIELRPCVSFSSLKAWVCSTTQPRGNWFFFQQAAAK